jgi:hypothetical protein
VGGQGGGEGELTWLAVAHAAGDGGPRPARAGDDLPPPPRHHRRRLREGQRASPSTRARVCGAGERLRFLMG